ncbi:hypothetical protein TSUD_123780 [Trifolium subterraneum]|uniref:Uncharacterized protein n=1 Tax=Trifolium subterraneum TaxID=3900 RepID=A0A2Z6P1V0_TRISU|nr:hypothetical protein TSUD_123780 [Trifolium subterraneum]
MINLRGLPYDHEDMENICCDAIERSRGHLENLNTESFVTDDLLEYIAENSSNLQCLQLGSCRLLSDEGFSKAVRKLPQLKEVDISFCNLSKYSLEVLGQSCPLLSSLKFVRTGIEYTEYDGDDEAAVIAKTMSGLRRLIMVKNDLSKIGLVRILNGCPLLESVEFEECFGLSDIDLSLWKFVKHMEKVFIYNFTDEVDNYSDDYDVDDDYYSYDKFLERLYKCKIPRS